MTTHLVIAMVALAAACTPQRSAVAPLLVADDSRISHPRQAQIACERCHHGAARPGTDEHRPCDDDTCHRKDFLGEPTQLGEIYLRAIIAVPLRALLKLLPAEDAWQAQPSRLSHKRHLDADTI